MRGKKKKQKPENALVRYHLRRGAQHRSPDAALPPATHLTLLLSVGCELTNEPTNKQTRRMAIPRIGSN